jgi:cardiolipin synthase A/B
MREAGVELMAYRPLNPLESAPCKLNNRNHRKILVVDDRVAFTGGMNVSGVYSSSSFSNPKTGTKPSVEGPWRDTQIRIAGPAVAAFERLFQRAWAEERGASDETREDGGDQGAPRVIQASLDRGNDLVRIVASDGGDDRYEIYEAYLAAIAHAQRRIWVTQAYFVPNREMRSALKRAAQRGVDVRILVPGVSDVQIALNASRAQYESLLRGGVRIYERDDAMVHAKTAVVDGVWSTVGSSNLDMQSFLHNDEANAVIIGRRFGRQMEDLFRRDMQHAREIDAEAWRHRPFTRKVVEQLASLFQYWI